MMEYKIYLKECNAYEENSHELTFHKGVDTRLQFHDRMAWDKFVKLIKSNGFLVVDARDYVDKEGFVRALITEGNSKKISPEKTISCDGCGKDITYTNDKDYRDICKECAHEH